jgi:hypothetical protein
MQWGVGEDNKFHKDLVCHTLDRYFEVSGKGKAETLTQFLDMYSFPPQVVSWIKEYMIS